MLVVPRFAFIKPALPMTAESPPSGPEDAAGIRLLTRNGYDWAQKYPLIVEAVNHLRVRSCLIDGEAAAATRTGLLCSRRCAGGERTRGCVYAFDLLELDGKDMRREPYEVRKATLASVLRQGRPGLRINEHLDYGRIGRVGQSDRHAAATAGRAQLCRRDRGVAEISRRRRPSNKCAA
jgi:ATP-dependent DNA ligase